STRSRRTPLHRPRRAPSRRAARRGRPVRLAPPRVGPGGHRLGGAGRGAPAAARPRRPPAHRVAGGERFRGDLRGERVPGGSGAGPRRGTPPDRGPRPRGAFRRGAALLLPGAQRRAGGGPPDAGRLPPPHRRRGKRARPARALRRPHPAGPAAPVAGRGGAAEGAPEVPMLPTAARMHAGYGFPGEPLVSFPFRPLTREAFEALLAGAGLAVAAYLTDDHVWVRAVPARWSPARNAAPPAVREEREDASPPPATPDGGGARCGRPRSHRAPLLIGEQGRTAGSAAPAGRPRGPGASAAELAGVIPARRARAGASWPRGASGSGGRSPSTGRRRRGGRRCGPSRPGSRGWRPAPSR